MNPKILHLCHYDIWRKNMLLSVKLKIINLARHLTKLRSLKPLIFNNFAKYRLKPWKSLATFNKNGPKGFLKYFSLSLILKPLICFLWPMEMTEFPPNIFFRLYIASLSRISSKNGKLYWSWAFFYVLDLQGNPNIFWVYFYLLKRILFLGHYSRLIDD